jgi:exosome complex component RRP42
MQSKGRRGVLSRFEVVSRLKRNRISTVLAQGKREDGRGLSDYRAIKIRKNVLDKAEGSAEVFLGDTRVFAGIKVDKGDPFPDTPNQAVLTVNAEFTPIASPAFEPGPPDETSVELARVVDRGIRSSEAIDLQKYCIVPGKSVYVIFVDLFILNHSGNLIDASALAAMAALQSTKLPKYTLESDKMIFLDAREPLELRDLPITVSMGKIGNSLIVDPTADEEDVMDTRLTIAINKDGHICAMQKSGSAGLDLEEIKKAINMAREKATEIRKLLMES